MIHDRIIHPRAGSLGRAGLPHGRLANGTRSARLWRRFLKWRAKRRALSKLRLMNDHMLADIGLTRRDVDPTYGVFIRDALELGRKLPRDGR